MVVIISQRGETYLPPQGWRLTPLSPILLNKDGQISMRYKDTETELGKKEIGNRDYSSRVFSNTDLFSPLSSHYAFAAGFARVPAHKFFQPESRYSSSFTPQAL